MKRAVVTMGLALLLLVPSATVFAANENASCPGLGISDHARAGEMPEELQAAKELLSANDVNLGEFMREFAQQHAETHVPGCENAAEDIIGDLVGG